MVNRKDFLNNFSLANNPTLLQGFFTGTERALVVKDQLPGLELLAVKDFYHLVIVESDSALVSVPAPDVFIYADDSPYRNFVLIYDNFFGLTRTIRVTNFNALDTFELLNRKLVGSNINYLPSSASPSTTAATVKTISCGLNAVAPGVHLALLMGCKTVYYTGNSSSATTVTLADLQAFVTAPTRLSLANLIVINRPTLLETL